MGEIPALAPTGRVALGRWPNRPVRWGRWEGCAVGEHAAPVPGEATRRAAPPAAVPPGVRRPLAAASPVGHGRPGLAPGQRVCPGCTRPDSGQVSVGVHSCTTTPGPRGRAGRVPMASGAPPPPHSPRAGAPGVCPHTLCFTRTRTLFGPRGIWNGATAGALHNSRHAEKDAGCLGCGLQPATCDLRPAQRKPRGAPPRAPTHRKMRGSEVLGHCIRRGLLQRKSSWTTARCRAHAGFPSHAPQGHEGALAPRPTDLGATYCRAPCAQCRSLDGEQRAAEHALCAVASEPSGQWAGPPGGEIHEAPCRPTARWTSFSPRSASPPALAC